MDTSSAEENQLIPANYSLNFIVRRNKTWTDEDGNNGSTGGEHGLSWAASNPAVTWTVMGVIIGAVVILLGILVYYLVKRYPPVVHVNGLAHPPNREEENPLNPVNDEQRGDMPMADLPRAHPPAV